MCVEFRHRTWMTEDNQRETLGFLAGNGLPYVCVDMPQGYPSSIPPVLAATSDLAVVRMHGHSDKWTDQGHRGEVRLPVRRGGTGRMGRPAP